MGFSQKIGFPARAAASIRSTCVSVEVAISTASTSETSRMISGALTARAELRCSLSSRRLDDIVDLGELEAGMAGDVGGVHPADTATTEQTDPDHAFLFSDGTPAGL